MDPLTLGVIGGSSLLGGIISAFGSYGAAKEAAAAGNRQAQMMIEEARRAYQDVLPQFEPYTQAGGRALSSLEEWTPTAAPGPFEWEGSVQEYLDPSVDFQRQEAQRALEQSAAASGGLYSGATMKALQDRAQDYAMQDYGNAYNRMANERAFSYQDYQNQFNNARMANMDKYNQLVGLVNSGQNAAGSIANLRTGQGSQAIQAIQSAMPGNVAAASAGGAAINNMGQTIGNIGNDIGRMMQYDQYVKAGMARPQNPYDVRSTGDLGL